LPVAGALGNVTEGLFQRSRLAAIVESSDDAIFSKSLDGIITSWNRGAERLLGYAAGEIVGSSMWLLIPESRREEESQAFERLKNGERIAAFETLRIRKNGAPVEVSVTLSPIESRSGKNLGISTIARDITAIRSAQRALARAKRAENKANEETARLAAIVESSDDAVFGKSLEGDIESWNGASERLFGYSAGEMIGSSMWTLIPESRRAEEARIFDRLKHGERIRAFETLRRRKDGSEVEVSVTLSPIVDRTGNCIGISTIARDITKMQAILRARDAADAANKELESFSYSVAHDLRAPLRGIDGFCQALTEDCADKLDADGRKYLGFIRESAQLMARLIDEILSLSRVVRSEFHSETVDLSALAYSAYTRLARNELGRSIEIVIQPGLVAGGDAKLLALVFNNLMGNALKFTSKRSAARIEFGAISEDGRPVYFVRDNGAGFDMAYASKLFGVFQRLHSAHEFEGNGVGLATVQRVVDRHGGRAWAEGKVDAGATVYFTLSEGEQIA
jgi:PAS domain S-box-containing protein